MSESPHNSVVSDVAPADPVADERGRVRERRGAQVAVAVCLAGFFVVELAVRAGGATRRLANESFYLAKPARFDEDKLGFDVVVTGDSRALHGIDPEAIERVLLAERGENLRVFNAGMSGAPPMAQYAWVRRALTQSRRRPRLVALSISPYMFSSRIAATIARESLGTMYRPRDVPGLVAAGAPLDDVVTALNGGVFMTARLRPRLLEVLTQFSGLRGAAEFDNRGFARNGEVDAYTQADRARGRALGYRFEMWKPESHLGNEHQGYFRQALRELRDAGVTAVVINAPAASQMELAYGPQSIYDEHIAYVRATARAYGARYFDAEHTPAVADEDFNDGDHLGGTGAARYSAWFAHEELVPALGGPRPVGTAPRPANCRTVFDFESDPPEGWTFAGDAFNPPTTAQARRNQQPAAGYVGHRFLDSYTRYGGDSGVGTARSPAFRLDGATLRLRVGGGAGTATRVTLRVGDVVARTARGPESETLRETSWDLGEFRGRDGVLEVFDETQGSWGHITLDDVALCP